MTLRIEGDISVPGDKSLTHRALMFSAAAQGVSRLRGLLPGDDCRNTANVLTALGVLIPDLPADGREVRFDSPGMKSWRPAANSLDCGNSGTTARLMLGLLAGLPFCSKLTGDASLRGRPMRRITEPLVEMGARVTELERPDRLPLEFCGGELRSLDHRSPKASAQIKSAVLLAGLSGGVRVSVWEPIRSRDHTERMLEALGIELEEGPRDGGWRVESHPPIRGLPPLDMEIPGDPSSAAFLISLATLADSGELRVSDVGTNPTRTGFFDALRRMGADLHVQNQRSSAGEPMADLVARPAHLHGITVEARDVPAMIDELPLLACVATRAEGETRITGAEELRAKESDRIAVIVSNLRSLGADVEELRDGLVVKGSDRPLEGLAQAHHDHRIAMAFGILAALPGNRIALDNPAVVDVSFPGFWAILDDLTSGAAPHRR